MKGYVGLLLMLVCLLCSCTKDDSFHSDKITPSKPNLQLVLTTKHVYSTSPYQDSLLGGVKVELYGNSYNRTLHKQVVKYGITDSTGHITFEYLSAQDYFVEATFPNTDTAQITVSYPSGAVTSFEDLLMVRR